MLFNSILSFPSSLAPQIIILFNALHFGKAPVQITWPIKNTHSISSLKKKHIYVRYRTTIPKDTTTNEIWKGIVFRYSPHSNCKNRHKAIFNHSSLPCQQTCFTPNANSRMSCSLVGLLHRISLILQDLVLTYPPITSMTQLPHSTHLDSPEQQPHLPCTDSFCRTCFLKWPPFYFSRCETCCRRVSACKHDSSTTSPLSVWKKVLSPCVLTVFRTVCFQQSTRHNQYNIPFANVNTCPHNVTRIWYPFINIQRVSCAIRTHMTPVYFKIILLILLATPVIFIYAAVHNIDIIDNESIQTSIPTRGSRPR